MEVSGSNEFVKGISEDNNALVSGNVGTMVINVNSVSDGCQQETRTKQPRTEEEMRCCRYCEFQAEDWPMFARHVLKRSHVETVVKALKIRATTEPVSNTLTCDICHIHCDGPVPWNAHLIGARHRKVKEQLANTISQENTMRNVAGGPMRNKQSGNMHSTTPYGLTQAGKSSSDLASYPQPLIGLEYVTEVQIAGEIPKYECSLCHAKFDHNLKFAHLVGYKHRMNTLKIKRPEALRGLNPANMKRSDITPVLLREATKLEQEEGRQEVKVKVLTPSGSLATGNFNQNAAGRGAVRGGRGITRGTRGNNRGSMGVGRAGGGNPPGGARGGGMSIGRGRAAGGPIMKPYPNTTAGSYPTPYGPGGHSAYNASYDSGFYGNNPSYNTAYNASYDSLEYGSNYQQSFDGGQTSYAGGAQTNFSSGEEYTKPKVENLNRLNIPPSELDSVKSKSKAGMSAGLASALGDLNKLVQNEEDASVALQVSNALTQALLQYRMTGEEN